MEYSGTVMVTNNTNASLLFEQAISWNMDPQARFSVSPPVGSEIANVPPNDTITLKVSCTLEWPNTQAGIYPQGSADMMITAVPLQNGQYDYAFQFSGGGSDSKLPPYYKYICSRLDSNACLVIVQNAA